MNLMIVHPAIQDELVLGRLLKCEVCARVLLAIICEDDSSVRKIDGGTIRSERIVQALKGHRRGRLCTYHLCVLPSAAPVGVIEDGAPPTGGVGEQRLARLFVDRHLLHLPDAIEWRDRSAWAPVFSVKSELGERHPTDAHDK